MPLIQKSETYLLCITLLRVNLDNQFFYENDGPSAKGQDEFAWIDKYSQYLIVRISSYTNTIYIRIGIQFVCPIMDHV